MSTGGCCSPGRDKGASQESSRADEGPRADLCRKDDGPDWREGSPHWLGRGPWEPRETGLGLSVPGTHRGCSQSLFLPPALADPAYPENLPPLAMRPWRWGLCTAGADLPASPGAWQATVSTSLSNQSLRRRRQREAASSPRSRVPRQAVGPGNTEVPPADWGKACDFSDISTQSL